MSEIKNISERIQYKMEKHFVEVELEPNQYSGKAIEQLKLFLPGDDVLLAGSIEEVSEERLKIRYEKPEEAVSLKQYIKKLDELERLMVAQKMQVLKRYMNQPVNPFIHPDNLFIAGEAVVVAHRGLLDVVVPYHVEEAAYLKQYKALILSIIQPKLDYEVLIGGAGAVRNGLSVQIQEATSFAIIDRLLMEQVTIQREKRNATNRLVKRKNYAFFKWSALVFILAAIGLAITLGVYGLKIVPKQERIMAAEASFISNDYGKVMDALKEDNPEELPKTAQYVLAASSIKLDNLSNEQKEVVLNTVSQNSSENTLLYWTYLGKGNFKKALNIGQNIGDNQYILHAYTKLYDATNTDNKMDGAKKQELLSQYEEEINKYEKLLGGKTDDTNTEAAS